MRRRLFWFAPLAIAGLLLFIFVGGEAVKLLWNWLLPALFGLPRISFEQALGLLVLSRILFGGFGGTRRERWTSRMTDAERERLRQRLRDRCGFGPPSTPAPGGTPAA
jgi:hypothetical protein